ncbi:MAG: hypothetical protein DME75_05230 [Verrucomicrobia bacterium]|nr:MAG: hypothetical protein DME75_05230 [Verrucomicrobiota bacterium]
MPNELWRLLQVWPESQPTYDGGLPELRDLRVDLPGLRKDVFREYRFAGESKRLLVKLQQIYPYVVR